MKEGQSHVYESFNLIVRRKPEENNFKAVLETIRDLLNSPSVLYTSDKNSASLPVWLQNIILGYGSPDAAHYK